MIIAKPSHQADINHSPAFWSTMATALYPTLASGRDLVAAPLAPFADWRTVLRAAVVDIPRWRAWLGSGVLPQDWADRTRRYAWAEIVVVALIARFDEQTGHPERLRALAETLLAVIRTATHYAIDRSMLPLACVHALLRQADADDEYRAVARRFGFDPGFALFRSYADYRRVIAADETALPRALTEAADRIDIADVWDLQLFCDLTDGGNLEKDAPVLYMVVQAIGPTVLVAPHNAADPLPLDLADGSAVTACTLLSVTTATQLAGRQLAHLGDSAK